MNIRGAVIALVAAWMLLLLGAPLAIILAIGLAHSADSVPPYSLGINLDNLSTVATDPYYRDALLRSVRVAGISSMLCLLAGFPMALAIARSRPRRQNALLLAVMLPFWSGFLTRINAWIGLMAEHGLLERMLGLPRLLYTETALYIGITYTYLPFMVLPLYARLTRIDPALAEAAADLGAPPAIVFWRVTLPLALPGVIAGLVLVFIPAVGEYVIPSLLGGPNAELVGVVLWDEFSANRDWPMAAAVALWLLLVLIVIPGGLMRLVRRMPRTLA
ncbi:MAG: putrescine ABC transporter permease PotH [Rhodospirillales bacterium 20-64-7]|nr:MAG: putrescine ABC transporter permease PotH [Rhodospirillales bacterium 20-64-7]HQT75416.1 ABC transporter permease subunit [Rhodopila sp.]